jgi:integrase
MFYSYNALEVLVKVFTQTFDTGSTHIRNGATMKLTKSVVDKLPVPIAIVNGQTSQKRYYDQSMKGFGVRVTSGGTKAFFVEKLIRKKLRRITIGKYPALTCEMARRKAQALLGQIAMGVDPLAEKRAAEAQKVTVKEVYEDYKKARKNLKASTLYNYERVLNGPFGSWKCKPLLSITKDKIAKHHEEVGKHHGEAFANLAMRVLRALFNFASSQYEDAQGKSIILENPVKRLSQTRAWYRIEGRQTYIKPHDLSPWYQSVKKLENSILRDYLILLLFTGLRRQEAATLRWEQIDLRNKTLTVIETKNHDTHTLPLSDYLYDLLTTCFQHKTNEYVFPGSGVGGYIIEPRKQMNKVIKETNIVFTCHDLRRTFITIAESLDIPAYALKRLLNHKMNGDVTAGYIMTDVERLRKPMQQVTDYLLKCMEIKELANILEIKVINQN